MRNFDEAVVSPETAAQRFSRRSALASERVYGRGHQGPAGEDLFAALAARCHLKPGMRVLDVGSGLGGDAFRLSSRYGVEVVGLDASADMTEICRERAAQDGARGATFVTGDVRTGSLELGMFDVLWTRDCGMYLSVPDKRLVWRRLFEVLVPGGTVLITDYCRGSDVASPGFESHVVGCGHHLVTPAGYREILAEAGFVDLVVEDRSADLGASMRGERETLVAQRADFVAEFSEGEYESLLERWDRKIDHTAAGELVWMLLLARRPDEVVGQYLG
ncbi:methyltransferase domain-containing protein [Micromonospora aurantiaca]|uniref:methyltransferase domain-containing protein n=1 Tax=Micromonospora aurantiaca (nom. illeg.) TaxID=47850 RepID=UPI0034561FAD